MCSLGQQTGSIKIISVDCQVSNKNSCEHVRETTFSLIFYITKCLPWLGDYEGLGRG